MTNKLAVVINSLKYQKLRKFYYYEMKFLVPNYTCLQNPWIRGYRPQIPSSLSSVLNWICWTPPRKKFLGTPLLNLTTKGRCMDGCMFEPPHQRNNSLHCNLMALWGWASCTASVENIWRIQASVRNWTTVTAVLPCLYTANGNKK